MSSADHVIDLSLRLTVTLCDGARPGVTSGRRRSSDGQIVVSGLTKQYKKVRAVDDLSFTVEPGRVTGFLGPNGAGKTTTLRMLLNLVTPTAGTATIGGQRYADLARAAAARRRGARGVQRAQGPHRHQPPAGDLRARPGCPGSAPTRRWRWSGSPRRPSASSRATRWACGSGSASPRRCSATRGC